MVQPIEKGLAEAVNAQDGMYTVLLRGLENGRPLTQKRVIKCVSRCINPYVDFNEYTAAMHNPHLRFIVSNTTEAGITYRERDRLTEKPPASFPAKVAALLYERYRHFNGDPGKGFIFLPCELIEDNGTTLKEIVLRHARDWGLGGGFTQWVEGANTFTNTLVDRIVTGYPAGEAEALFEEWGYRDALLTAAEPYHFFAIETRDVEGLKRELPLADAGLNVVITTDITPYRARKVRILNGAHTLSALAAFLMGRDTVLEMMQDKPLTALIHKGIFREIIPSMDACGNELTAYARSVLERFANPYIQHALLGISLNSVAKFKTRIIPSVLAYHKKFNALPEALTFSFAALLAFYRGHEIRDGALTGHRHGNPYPIKDDKEVLDYFMEQWRGVGDSYEELNAMTARIGAREDYWGVNLQEIPGFTQKAAGYLHGIVQNGIREVINHVANP
jgi:tagaturonate reductase